MDGATYHKVLLNPSPVKGKEWPRPKVIDWLKMRGEQLKKTLITDEQCLPAGKDKPGLTLAEMFDIVKANKPDPHFKVYDIASEYGHTVVFTPSYSPLANP